MVNGLINKKDLHCSIVGFLATNIANFCKINLLVKIFLSQFNNTIQQSNPTEKSL